MVPRGAVTLIAPDCAPCGTTVVIWLSESTVKPVEMTVPPPGNVS